MNGPDPSLPYASTRSAVLDTVRAAGTISRIGLVQATGLTGATISTVVRRLIDDGLIVETGHAASTGGKRRILLQLNQDARYAVGVQLAHDRVTYVLTNLNGVVVAQLSGTDIGLSEPGKVLAATAEAVDTLIQSVGVEHGKIIGLGLVFPGPLGASSGMGQAPTAMREWEAFPIRAALEEATGLPVVIDNDATAAAIGEHWSGGAGSTSAFAAVYMGAGIGAGIVINGTAYRGVSGNAGEIGHLCVDPSGRQCWCGAQGCTEAMAGTASVVGAARADEASRREAGLLERADSSPSSVSADFAAIARAAHRGEPRCQSLLEESARHLAVAIRGLANAMDLEVIVLTGPSMAVAGSVYLPVVQQDLDERFFARDVHRVEVRLSQTAATAPAIGGAAMVLRSELAPLRQVRLLPEALSGTGSGAERGSHTEG